MAGSLYLGSNKVCPAVVIGGTEEITARYTISDGVLSKRSGELTGNEFTNIKEIEDSGFAYAFYNCSSISGGVNLSSVETIGMFGMKSAFEHCRSDEEYFGITSVDLSSLETVDMYGMEMAFSETLIESADLSSLKSVGYAGMRKCFYGDPVLTSVDLSSLESVGRNGLEQAFWNSGIQTVEFTSLNSISRQGFMQTFIGCLDLESLYFNSLTTNSFENPTVFQGMFDSDTGWFSGGCTVHFPSNMQATISGLQGYPLFGGDYGSISLAFDLPATS